MASRIEIKTQIKPFTTEEPQLLKFTTTAGNCLFNVQKCETDIEAVDVAPYFYENSPITQFCPKDDVSIMGTVWAGAFRNSNLSGAVEVRGRGESYAFEGTGITSVKFLSEHVYQYVCKDCKSLQVAYVLGTTTYGSDYFKNCTALKKIVLPENVQLISKSMIPWEVSQAFRGTIVLTATTMEQANNIVGVSDLKYTDIECTDGTIHCE